MSRYIDADKLYERIKMSDYMLSKSQVSCGIVVGVTGLGLKQATDYGMFTTDVKQAIDETPTADVAKIVRCKNCVYYRPFDKSERKDYDEDGTCLMHRRTTNETDFCSTGSDHFKVNAEGSSN